MAANVLVRVGVVEKYGYVLYMQGVMDLDCSALEQLIDSRHRPYLGAEIRQKLLRVIGFPEEPAIDQRHYLLIDERKQRDRKGGRRHSDDDVRPLTVTVDI